MILHSELTDKELIKIIKKCKVEYLIRCEKAIPNFFELLRNEGITYINLLMLNEEDLKSNKYHKQ